MRGQNIYERARSLWMEMVAGGTRLAKAEALGMYDSYFLLLRKAAYLGHPEAQYDYGQQFEDVGFLGLHNPNYNPERCVYWYGKASLQGHGAAYNNLAHMYERGIGCRKSLRKALALYRKSAELGYKPGKQNYKLMKRQLEQPGSM